MRRHTDRDLAKWLEKAMQAERPHDLKPPPTVDALTSDELLASLACWLRAIYARLTTCRERDTLVCELTYGDEDRLRLMLADADRHLRTGGDRSPACDHCGQVMRYESPVAREPDIGYSGWRGGYVCDCGHCQENEPPHGDEWIDSERDRMAEMEGGAQ